MHQNMLKLLLFDDVFGTFDIIMATAGIHKFYQHENQLNKFRLFQYLLCVIMTSNLVLLCCGGVLFVFTSESILAILEEFPNILVSVNSLIKLATLIVRRKLIYEVIHDLKSLWPQADDENGIKRFHEIVSPTYKICLLFLILITGTALAFGMTPILGAMMDYIQRGEAHVKLAYAIWYPFDYEKSNLIFVFVYISQFWGAYAAAVYNGACDIFMCMLISLLCYHFKMISDSLKAIQPKQNNCNQYMLEAANDYLKECILYHDHLLRLCQLLEDIFSFPLFVNLSVTAIILCALFFNIMVVPPDKIATFILYISAISLQVFMLCWYSDILIRQHSKLTSAAYNSSWYNTDKFFKMNLIQFQMRTQKPVALTAMKFLTLSNSTFLHIAASAWSYFTLLRKVYEK